MNTRVFPYRKVCLPAAGVVLFALLVWLTATTGRFTFSYLEQWGTFVYQRDYIARTVAVPGGCARLAAAFLVQFFCRPMAGIGITAALLTVVALLMNSVLRGWSGGRITFPLALFPVAALFLLHFDVWYRYAGTVAFLFLLLLLRLHLSFKRFLYRLVYGIISTVVLFIVAGPVAFLYGCLLLVIELYYLHWRSLCFLLPPLLALGLAWCSVRAGYAGEVKEMLLPRGYFMPRMEPGLGVYLPWLLTAAVFVLTALCARFRLKRVWMKVAVAVALVAGVVKFTAWGMGREVDHKYETFKELNYYMYHNEWGKIVDKCGAMPMNNLLYQNCLNVALAERGVLADVLFHEPCHDRRSLYVEGEKDPHVYALLSDIYFSMGHIALAQRYAFEGNEGVDNFSPRMLRRLVETNLAYGNYATAAKYITVLEHTLYYKAWAESRRRLLWNDKAVEQDALLGAKRKCIFPDNRFAAIKGLDDDLKQVIMQNPAHKATIQYLGSLYLLSKDVVRFKEMLELFYGTPALPEGKLPASFQEGVLVFSGGNQEVLARYHIEPSTFARFSSFVKQPKAERQNLWYFLKYVQ